MDIQSAIQMLKGIMGNKHWTTKELEDLLDSFGYQCPDGLPRSLSMLRDMGELNGEYDENTGCWYWWA